MHDGFWLTDEQFQRLEPFLPTDTRGVARGDDRRVISGIAQVLKSGCRWKDASTDYGPHKTLYNRFVRWRAKGVWENAGASCCGWSPSGGPARQYARKSASLRCWRKRGALAQAIGVSRGRAEHQNPRAERWRRQAYRLPDNGWECRRCSASGWVT